MNRSFHLDQFIRACDGRKFPNQLGILMLTLGCSWNGFEHNVFYLNLPGEGLVNVAFLLDVSHEFDSRVVGGG